MTLIAELIAPPDTPLADTPPLTDWIDGHLHPAREGVYARRFPAGPYSCWNAEGWHVDTLTPDEAADHRALSPHQNVAWRGLSAASGLPCETCGGHGVLDHGHDEDTGSDLIDECPDC
jgi:hypothetical protein